MNRWSLAFGLAVAAYLIFGVIFNESAVWTNPEIPAYFYPRAFETGKDFCWADLGRVFDWQAFCGGARTRIASTLLLIFNAKFRQYWLDWFSPHPSLNVAWLWSLLLTPLAFYWAAKELLKDKTAAFNATLIYFVSTGSLSGIAFNHHPGKPISNFFLALAFGITFRIQNLLSNKEKVRREWGYLSVAIACGMLFDEVPFFCLVLIPVLLWESRAKREIRLPLAISLGVPLLIVAGFFLGLAPSIANHLGYHGYPLFRYATTPDSPHHGLRMAALLENLIYLPKDQLPVMGGLIPSAIAVIAFFVFSIRNAISKALFAAVVLFAILQTILMSRVSSESLGGTFYYGSGFSVLFSFYLGAFLQTLPIKWHHAALAILIGFSILHFKNNNRIWRQGHLAMYDAYFQLGSAQWPENQVFATFVDWERRQHAQSWNVVSSEGIEKGLPFRGKKLSEVELELGKSEGSCGLAESLSYPLDENRRLVFLPTNHHLFVRKVMVLPACTIEP